jgi:hypothetical protein
MHSWLFVANCMHPCICACEQSHGMSALNVRYRMALATIKNY